MINTNLTDRVSDGSDKDLSKYYDKYFVEISGNDARIVSYGSNPAEIMKEARELGHKNPVIGYFPHPDKMGIGGQFF